MIIEPDGTGGWFVDEVDHLNASIHLTVDWLTEYEHHNGPQHTLRWLLTSESTDSETVGRALAETLDNRKRPEKPQKRARSPELAEWKRGRRGRNST